MTAHRFKVGDRLRHKGDEGVVLDLLWTAPDELTEPKPYYAVERDGWELHWLDSQVKT